MLDVFSKLVWTLLKPDTWLIVGLLLGLFAVRKNRIRIFFTIQICIVISLILLTKFPLGDVILGPLERAYSPPQKIEKKIDGIIVLGGAEHKPLSDHWGQLITSQAAERLMAAISLSRQFPEAKVVYVGKSSSALEQAIPKSKNNGLFFEEVSAFELERTAKSTVQSTKPFNTSKEQRWVLITSAFHMPRSINVFCSAGIRVIPFPVDYRTGAFRERSRWNLAVHLSDLNTGLKEWIGLLGYRFSGNTQSIWPAKKCVIH